MTSNITRNPVKWPGGKWRLSGRILAVMQEIRHAVYCEPFGGGASILLRKPHNPTIRDVYNDLDSEVYWFFRVLREDEDALVRAIRLTPFSEEEYKRAYEPCDDPLERARRLYIRLRQGFPGDIPAAFHSGTRSGWRRNNDNITGGHQPGQKYGGPLKQWQDVDYLHAAAARLRLIELNNNDWYVVMRKYDRPHTLFYVDPPYLQSVMRGKRSLYGFDFGSEKDHRELSKFLHGVQGLVILSGYPSQLYDELYAGWNTISLIDRDTHNQTTTETLWLSPNISRLEQKTFFDCV
jgi:DNA adenine methylase